MRIGIDFGGTKIEGILLDESGAEKARMRGPTPRHDYDGSVRMVRDLVARLEREAGREGLSVGVGIPGSISPASGTVRNANAVWLLGKPFDRDIGEALGREVRMANDANCLAVSEAVDGAGADARIVWGVIVGTGVGGGLAIDREVIGGRNGVAGEWGHIPLPRMTDEERPGPRCYCGRHGCLEVWLSGVAFAADFARAVGAGEGDGPNSREIMEMARAGDEDAAAAFDRYVDRFARALGTLINIVDPDVIVLGGGMSNVGEIYERLPTAMAPHVFSDTVATEIRRNVHGDSSGVRGAAWLWPQVGAE